MRGVIVFVAALATIGPLKAQEAHSERIRADWKQQVVRYFRETLKDPYSIRSARISQPKATKSLFDGNVWMICVEFNAKNSYGAYVGLKTTPIYMTRDGRIFDYGTTIYCPPSSGFTDFPQLEAIK